MRNITPRLAVEAVPESSRAPQPDVSQRQFTVSRGFGFVAPGLDPADSPPALDPAPLACLRGAEQLSDSNRCCAEYFVYGCCRQDQFARGGFDEIGFSHGGLVEGETPDRLADPLSQVGLNGF